MTTVIARTAADWRAWLAQHSQSETEAWLVIAHKDSSKASGAWQPDGDEP